MSLKVALFIVASVVVASVADQIPIYHEPQYGPPAPSYHVPVEEYPDVPPQYKYNYGVSDGYSGANFGHSESRDGYKTEGSYSVDLPDGRKQIVTYVDNGDGLEAQVTYEGEAQYPDHSQPAYPAPPPEPVYAPEPVYVPEPSYPAPPPPPPAYPA
ncbi:larval cuticle protein A2B-like [Scylla paramamosain]|uniref:larval cuticle protein A2B-like n=1 Tax=Scylla paramamosain TaxID=85552 RepID=UPI003082D2E2